MVRKSVLLDRDDRTILYLIYKNKDISIYDLSKKLNREHNISIGYNSLLVRLKNHYKYGWIERDKLKNTENRTVVLLKITITGKKILKVFEFLENENEEPLKNKT